MIYGIKTTSHGNYICPFCPKKKIMKTYSGIIEHVEREHPTDVWNTERDRKVAMQRAETAEEKLRIYMEQARQEPKTEYYDATWSCSNCLKLFSGGLPKNYPITDVACGDCGMCKLHLVTNVRQFSTE